MGFWNEYNPATGIVFDAIDDAINAALGPTAGGGGAPPPPPGKTGADAPPPGSKMQGPNNAIDNNGYTWHLGANGWEQGYIASAAAQREAGIGPSARAGGTSGGGTNVNYQQQGVDNKTAIQQSQGAMASLPPRAFEYAPGRAYWQPAGSLAGSVLQKDPSTGLWVTSGFPVSSADKAAVMQGIRAEIAAGRWNGTAPVAGGTPTTTTSSQSPYAGLAGAPGTLTNASGVNIAGLDPFRQSGIGIPQEGRRTLTDYGLNTMQAGRQGSLTQFPVAPGFRGPGETGNAIQFANGSYGARTLEPQMVFAPAVASVPDTYVRGQGNVNDANRAYDVPFNIGSGGAGLLNIAGNNVQLQSADKGTGYGYALNAMPSSSVFALTGRNGSEDPALQAVQQLQLQAAINQYGLGALMATNPNQFGGYHAGTGNDPFSGNGGMAQGQFWGGYSPDPEGGYRTSDGAYIFGGGGGDVPFGSMATGGRVIYDPFVRMAGGGSVASHPLAGMSGGPKQLVTNEPILGVSLPALQRGRIVPRLLVGEDNADRGYAPNKELLSFGNGQMRVTPLQPPVRMADGGTVTSAPALFRNNITQQIQEFPNGIDPEAAGMWDPYTPPASDPTPPPPVQWAPTPPPPNAPNGPEETPGANQPTDPNVIPIDPGGIYAPTNSTTPPPPPPEPAYDPFNPNILAPYQSAINTLDLQDARRNQYQYRRAAGNLGREQGRTVLNGGVPGTDAGAGMFWDMRPQVTNAVNEILGNQSALRSLGPNEDVTSAWQNVSDIGNNLSDIQRIRDLQDARVAVQAGGNVPSLTGTSLDVPALLNTMSELEHELQVVNANGNSPSSLAAFNYGSLQELQNAYAQAQHAYNQALNTTQAISTETGDKTAVIDAQIAALQARLPPGANEASLRTKLAQYQDQIAKQKKRTDLSSVIQNLSKAGVPSLTAPIQSVDPFAQAAA